MDIYKIKPSIDKNSPSKTYIPANLNDCFVELKKILHPQFIEKLKNTAADGRVGDVDIFLILWITENWGFRENSRLAKYFENYLQMAKQYEDDENYPKEDLAKIVIPEETANFVVGAFQRYLKGEISDAEKYMEFIKKLRIAGTPPNNKELTFPQCISGVQLEGMIEGDSEEQANIIHYGRCNSDKRLWVFDHSEGWYLPDAPLTKQITNFPKLPKLQKAAKPVGSNEFKEIN